MGVIWHKREHGMGWDIIIVDKIRNYSNLIELMIVIL